MQHLKFEIAQLTLLLLCKIIIKYCDFITFFSLRFHTDPAAVASGFRLEWYNEGCGGRLTAPKGILTSPNYPRRYDHELTCIWEIIVDYGHSVKFTVQDLDIELSSECQFDSLIIAHDSNFTNQITKICRPIHNALSLVAEGHIVFVKFESDESENGKGFKISYETIVSGK